MFKGHNKRGVSKIEDVYRVCDYVSILHRTLSLLQEGGGGEGGGKH